MGCCSSIIRFLFVIFNIIFFLIGVVIMGVGIWLKVSKDSLFEIMRKIDLDEASGSLNSTNTSVLDVIAIVLIVLGVLTFIIGFCGCCGAWKQSKCLLMIYAALVIVIIIAEIGLGIYAGLQKEKTQKFLSKNIKTLIKNDFNGYLNANSSAFTMLLTSAMTELKCCGADGIDDFDNIVKYKRTPNKNPIGCCQMKDGKTLSVENKDKKKVDELKKMMVNDKCYSEPDVYIHNIGCVKQVDNVLKKNINIIIGVCVGFGLLEIVMVIIACCVAKKDTDGTEA